MECQLFRHIVHLNGQISTIFQVPTYSNKLDPIGFVILQLNTYYIRPQTPDT